MCTPGPSDYSWVDFRIQRLSTDQIQVELQQNASCSILELNITLNEPELV